MKNWIIICFIIVILGMTFLVFTQTYEKPWMREFHMRHPLIFRSIYHDNIPTIEEHPIMFQISNTGDFDVDKIMLIKYESELFDGKLLFNIGESIFNSTLKGNIIENRSKREGDMIYLNITTPSIIQNGTYINITFCYSYNIDLILESTSNNIRYGEYRGPSLDSMPIGFSKGQRPIDPLQQKDIRGTRYFTYMLPFSLENYGSKDCNNDGFINIIMIKGSDNINNFICKGYNLDNNTFLGKVTLNAKKPKLVCSFDIPNESSQIELMFQVDITENIKVRYIGT
jgi:hypothetical protein